ncbi:hypothetical protein IIM_04176 [Bacillus cereus VD107]|nr:hypothetical protein IIM_04176 [Bacillus cereus VD107]
MRRAGHWNWIYLKAAAARPLPSSKHKIPRFLAGDFFTAILRSSPLMQVISLFSIYQAL